MKIRGRFVALGIFALCSTPGPGLAADGVVEISQSAALAGGITPSDAPGFPVTLDASGSYVLTSNLVVEDPNAIAVRIEEDDVHLDLNGFQLRGPISCSSAQGPITCDPGSGFGVWSDGASRTSLTNGSVTGFALDGVSLRSGSRVEGVTARANGSDGIEVGANSIVRESVAIGNAGNGIRSGPHSVVEAATANGNAFRGFNLSDGSTLVRATATANFSDGIICGSACNLRGITSLQNLGDGVATGAGAAIAGATIRSNGNEGIEGGDDTVISGCAITSNLTGLRVGARSNVSGSTVTGNGVGLILGNDARVTGNNISSNSLDGIQLNVTSGAGYLNLTDNSIRVNSGAGVANITAGGTSVLLSASGNTIVGNSPDLATFVFDLGLGCNRVGTTTSCPP